MANRGMEWCGPWVTACLVHARLAVTQGLHQTITMVSWSRQWGVASHAPAWLATAHGLPQITLWLHALHLTHGCQVGIL